VVASALADAAIRQVLQEVSARKSPITRTVEVAVPFQGQSVAVQVQPLAGLIDLNNAPEPLLAALFQHGAGLPADAAAQLAKATADTRSRRDPQGRPEGFDAPEDLLRVPGITYPLYATIARLVSADLTGSGRVNPQAAPLSVLAVLLQGNTALAAQWSARLAATPDATPLPMDTTQFNAAFIDSAPARTLRVVARVRLADGAVLLRTWTVGLAESLQTGLPWRVVDIRQHIEPLAPQGTN
jgi:general secretion pathway protein K